MQLHAILAVDEATRQLDSPVVKCNFKHAGIGFTYLRSHIVHLRRYVENGVRTSVCTFAH